MAARMIDPFHDVDRVFNEMMGAQGAHLPFETGLLPLDLCRDGDHFTMTMDMPGVDPGSIDLSVEDNTLTVRASRTTSALSEGAQWLARERASGTFARQISLGRGLDTSRITARYDNGVLQVTIPVSAEAKPRKIAVEHSTAGATQIAAERAPSDTTPAHAG